MTLNKEELFRFIELRLEERGYFPVLVDIHQDGFIDVEIDGAKPVDIDMCAGLSREIEEAFAPEIEEYDLTVGSAGLTSPFRVPRQYQKNIGNEAEVLTTDGRKLRGRILEADDEGFTLGVDTKVKHEGMKRASVEQIPHQFKYENVKYAKYILQF